MTTHVHFPKRGLNGSGPHLAAGHGPCPDRSGWEEDLGADETTRPCPNHHLPLLSRPRLETAKGGKPSQKKKWEKGKPKTENRKTAKGQAGWATTGSHAIRTPTGCVEKSTMDNG